MDKSPIRDTATAVNGYELERLRTEHRQLERDIDTLLARKFLSDDDQLEVTRLKRLRLQKKERITLLESGVHPRVRA